MAYGYAGKILLVDLTAKTTSTIDTAKYAEFGGGVGIGAAIFWDLAVAPGDWDLQDAFDPRNVISLMSGPLARLEFLEADVPACAPLLPRHSPPRCFIAPVSAADSPPCSNWRDGTESWYGEKRTDPSGSTSSMTK